MDNFLDGPDDLMKVMFWVFCITIPLALWKICDILMWLVEHVEIGLK